METKLIKGMKWISKVIMYLLLILIIICMILGTGHIFIYLFQSIGFEDPNHFLINIDNIYPIFAFILIILIGYELFNAIIHVIGSKKIPVKEIMQISMIALGNKIITLDVKSAGMNVMIGLGVIIFSLGVSYFFFNTKTKTDNIALP